MIRAEVQGTLKKILFESDRSFQFVLTDGTDELLCTITKSHIDLKSSLTKGNDYKLNGTIKLYRKTNDKGTFTRNVFYIENAEQIEKGECK